MEKTLSLFVMVICVACTSSINAEGPNRIINGLPATENQFPYMISLQQLSQVHSATRGHKCGGALVTLQHAVTSAFCTFLRGRGGVLSGAPNWVLPSINPAEYRVFAGSVALTNDTSADRIRRIANITAHPEFPAFTNPYLNDIAVIILGTPFLSNTVAQLSVIDIGSDVLSCTLTGWGSTTQLMHARITTLNQTMCRRFDTSVLPSMVCGWTINGGLGTSGDVGGPLVCRGSLVGIFIDYGSTPNRPQVYTRVSNYTTWINNVVAQPIPELGPEPSTQMPPTTSPTPAPGGAPTFQPGLAVLAVIAIAQIIIANVIN